MRHDPYIGEMKSGDLAGIYCFDYKYQGTNYELAYRIEEDEQGEIIFLIMTGTRENFYHQLKTYLKN
ncbi:type II toxin-antitoxin system RelE/ParE family toxin [Lentibacillus populi]|uniref:type II toxin-antitoxin system RelE/ParE family toxin n=1 Tax=Lentibacillus populi TaxID=1827502 RepID=UPI0022859E62|nr:type II toxin-antitoxin system RelE/ParE family toxin [Lentibacillus populi]